jgi:photosystem II stability/assembly factor-like uncharacterized protein
VRRNILASLLGAASVLVSFPAAANGRFPLSNQIVFSQTDPNLVVVRTSYGILPSHDNGKTWGYICEDVVGISPSTLADPAVALTHNNSLIVGLALGLNVSPDVGCNWNCIGGPLSGQSIADVAVRPDNPSSAVAVTSTYLPSDSGVLLSSSQVFETTDDGVTWAALGVALDPHVVVDTVDVSKSDPQRLYVSGTVGFGAARTAHLFVSYDKGQTWFDNQLPTNVFDPSMEDSVFIGAIDPVNPDRLYMRSDGLPTGGESRLTKVDLGPDGGAAMFTTAEDFDVEAGPLGFTGELLGFALSPDGSKIYIGTKEEGLWMAQTSDLKFTKKKQFSVQCLATRGNELWACGPAVDKFVVGKSTDDGVTFTTMLDLIGDLTGPIACKANPAGAACGGDANASQCGAAYDLFCSQNICGPPPDAAAGDGPSDGGTTPMTGDASTTGGGGSSSSSCSCDLARLGGGGAAALGAGIAMLGVALHRRRRTRR